MAEKNGTPKWIVKVLVLLLVSFVTWWATQTWSRQEVTNQMNTQQGADIQQQATSIETLQKNIIANGKAITSLETEFYEFREERRQKDSILQDVSFKINLMFDGR